MANIRKDVATLGSPWASELEWYARAVTRLQTLTPDKRTSWRYLGALHGFNRNTWLANRVITDADPLPPTAEWRGRMWQQCQHQGWYFLPWHRGYLAAFESIVAKAIVDLGGPNDWALPYWNYFDPGNPQARNVPQAFVDPTLPDGSPNPLSAPPRSGITALGPSPDFPGDIDLGAMDAHRFTSAARALGFGGGVTVFNQFGGQTGALESDPHNSVHVMLGGQSGFMADPDLAGLDPIFWLHHCNVDRLWAAWLTRTGNVQENGAAWRNGPSPRVFEMPDAAGNLVTFTPAETLPGGRLAPTYDDLTIGTGAGPGGAVVASGDDQGGIASMGDDAEESHMPASLSDAPPPAATLVGENKAKLTIGAAAAMTTVEIAPTEGGAASVGGEQRVYLNLEHVRGTAPSGVLNVLISAPAQGAAPARAPEAVKPVALFGLARASSPEDAHGGNGISIALDVTDLVRQIAKGAPLEKLEVHLQQPGGGEHPITVDRVSLYRQPVE